MITLNSPSKLNALTEDMGNELTATVGQLEGKKELRAAILTGFHAVIQRSSLVWYHFKVLGKHSVLGVIWPGC